MEHLTAKYPCNVVIFGGNGDLAIRKLLPALYNLDRAGYLCENTRVIGASRTDLGRDGYIDLVKQGMDEFIDRDEWDEAVWDRFAARLSYVAVNAREPETFQLLADELDKDFSCQDTVYYLSTAPDFFGEISRHLNATGLVNDHSRVVLEKPIGKSLESSKVINDAVSEVFAEDNIYRIDHYLGKETVQNLLAVRFANALFEPVWTNAHIDNVQITVAETVGVEGRWGYYDDSGALRDMIQNHLLQLLCLVAMGVPVSLDTDAVRAEKIKVLKSLKKMDIEQVRRNTVRAQYAAGTIGGQQVPGYQEEEGGKPNSQTETFVAIRADIHNWRWRGVPFYLRTGKRLPSRYSEIVIQFKDVPHSIFPHGSNLSGNKLVIRLQPEESIQLFMMNKLPGLGEGMQMTPVTLNLTMPDHIADVRVPEAYERLILDVIRGNSTLFVHRDEVEAAWVWADAILDGWRQSTVAPHAYPSGSWGPQAAFELVARDGRSWHESS
ncbi:glucose-6-phosphate dehydrogenase [Saccharospirillum salsuginis]|uniref:Glucose-6-phosphate 1-dehydrogenase n=1 Tax=Saccharospirillum salsuginis TaxID=418750 RepID=A0A918N4W9_9GAMM|nr:glucose-6-phosphate dehydrogenase [Saccharospirillum salsuginis]GGX39545.1 glucose-6-phosphate 1-dehydrogenase [Saccharospirillum salsuginis]